MKKQILYMYLGTNGTITSAVHLEGIYYVRKVQLTADEDKTLINKKTNKKCYTVVVPEENVDDWYEIELI